MLTQNTMNNDAIVKRDLSRSVPKQLEQAQKVASMSAEVMPPADPNVAAMATSNTDLAAKMAQGQEAKQASVHAIQALNASADENRGAYNGLANAVQNASGGSGVFITSTGFGVPRQTHSAL